MFTLEVFRNITILRILARLKIIILFLRLFLVFFAVFEKVLFGDLSQNGEHIDHFFALPLRFGILFNPFFLLFFTQFESFRLNLGEHYTGIEDEELKQVSQRVILLQFGLLCNDFDQSGDLVRF